ncbi:Prohibitin-1 [Candida viswanathii]|uniref:Prohibitin n=1 Tax=Candida viswanathii TaxID=5486 RepID=A0A367YEL6_9ASCO|nr:Prohibitin-1 [Candida viswanathii]
MSQRFADVISKIALPAGLTIALVQASMYDVPGGQRAIIFDRLKGVEQKVIGEGTHFLIPWLQKPVIFDVRIQPRVITTMTGSKDLQNVSLSLRVLSRPEVRMLPTIYQSLGLDYAERVLPAIGNEILKSIVAQFDAAELITQREVVSARIRQELSHRARQFNIQLEDVSITHMTFGREFTKAVEQKQIAQQDAERSKYLVEKAEQEKKAAIIRAEGEAEAADVVSKALAKAGDGLLMIRKLDASKDIAATLANSPNITYLPDGQTGNGGVGSGNSLLLNIGR